MAKLVKRIRNLTVLGRDARRRPTSHVLRGVCDPHPYPTPHFTQGESQIPILTNLHITPCNFENATPHPLYIFLIKSRTYGLFRFRTKLCRCCTKLHKVPPLFNCNCNFLQLQLQLTPTPSFRVAASNDPHPPQYRNTPRQGTQTTPFNPYVFLFFLLLSFIHPIFPSSARMACTYCRNIIDFANQYS